MVRNFNRHSLDFDAYSESALHQVRGKAPGFLDAEDIAWAAAHGDPFSLALLREAALTLALLLKNVFTSTLQ